MVNNERSSMILLLMFIAVGANESSLLLFQYNLLMACKYLSGVSPEAATW